MSANSTRVRVIVFGTVMLAASCLAVAWQGHAEFPGGWPFVSFIVVAVLLERTGSNLRFEAKGSTSFVIHLASGILFGPFWGSLIAGASTAISQLLDRKPGVKVLFNACQHLVSVAGGLLVTELAGAQFPLFGLGATERLGAIHFGHDLFYFLLFAGLYFTSNSATVSAVISASTGNRFMEVWHFSGRGVIGYDLAASFLAIALAWLYVGFQDWVGAGSLGLVLALAPIVAIRHVYGLYRRLQNSGRELLDLMVKAIEARDPYTSGHSVRVATLAKAIAQEAKMSAEEVEQVFTAAVLHDVGKIHEEFAPLLRKDSKLTPEETALLQTHPVKSADLVGIISSFRGTVQDAVRSHHERWDGGGYPDGLAGEAIPLGARIIMISDTTDAMTTDRPYRKRLPIDAVVAELQKYRGTQFDPRLVDMVVNSVTVRRVMSDVSAASSRPAESPSDNGSKRVQSTPGGLLRGRPSWPRIRAF